MAEKIDSIELLMQTPISPLMFKVSKATGLSYCIVPDLSDLSSSDDENLHRLAEWATAMAADLKLPVRFWVSLDRRSLEYESLQGSHYLVGRN